MVQIMPLAVDVAAGPIDIIDIMGAPEAGKAMHVQDGDVHRQSLDIRESISARSRVNNWVPSGKLT